MKIITKIDGTLLTISMGAEVLQIDASALTGTMQRHALMHGLKQKICDAAAIGRNPETGKSATDAEKIAAMRTVIARVVAGEWNSTQRGTGSAANEILIEALHRVTGKALEQLRAYVAEQKRSTIEALRLNPRIAETIAEIIEERGNGEQIDIDASIDEFLEGRAN